MHIINITSNGLKHCADSGKAFCPDTEAGRALETEGGLGKSMGCWLSSDLVSAALSFTFFHFIPSHPFFFTLFCPYQNWSCKYKTLMYWEFTMKNKVLTETVWHLTEISSQKPKNDILCVYIHTLYICVYVYIHSYKP